MNLYKNTLKHTKKMKFKKFKTQTIVFYVSKCVYVRLIVCNRFCVCHRVILSLYIFKLFINIY